MSSKLLNRMQRTTKKNDYVTVKCTSKDRSMNRGVLFSESKDQEIIQ